MSIDNIIALIRSFGLAAILGTGAFFSIAPTGQHNTASVHAVVGKSGEHSDGNCAMIVPDNPLTAQGLATPYRLLPQCKEADPAVGAFVQATIVDPQGNLFVYDPLVIDNNQAAIRPVVPNIPTGSVVAIWTGFQGNILTLKGDGAQGFVQGFAGSPFGQVASDNAPAFFAAAQARHSVIPNPGMGLDGRPCPTTRDFAVVDQDPSDNVTTTYLVNANGQTAQDTKINQMNLTGTVRIGNGSDNRLLTHFLDPALGCVPFTAPNLADNNVPATSQGLDELQAAAFPAATGVALVPVNDPMTMVNVTLSADKTNAYRDGVGQPHVSGDLTAAATAYCQNLQAIASARIILDMPFTSISTSPVKGMDLYHFLIDRYRASVELLNCAVFGGVVTVNFP